MDAALEAEAKRASGAAAHRVWAKKEAERVQAEEKMKEQEAVLEASREKAAAARAAQLEQRRSATAPVSASRVNLVSARRLKRPAVPIQTRPKASATIERLRMERAQRFQRLSLTLSPYLTPLPAIKPFRIIATR